MKKFKGLTASLTSSVAPIALAIAAAPVGFAESNGANFENQPSRAAASWGDIAAFGGSSTAQWGDIAAFGGSSSAQWGDIAAFSGSANAQWGDIAAFWGDIAAFAGGSEARWGDIAAFWGDIAAFNGSANASWGDIAAFGGRNDPRWGDIAAFWGDIAAFGGQSRAQWGDIAAFNGSANASWGDIAAFWGDIAAFEGQSQAQWGDIAAFWGDIAAFEGQSQAQWGDIAAFWGDIAAFEGKANPEWGDIAAFWGDIAAFQGQANPEWGDIAAFWGDIAAFDGSSKAQWGDIAAFGGANDPRWGDIAAFWGDIAAFQGQANPEWGDIAAFWGDIAAFDGELSATWGDIAAFDGDARARWGDIAAFWGDIAAFEGSSEARWGDIAAFWGDIAAFGGSSDPRWGDIAAFWGDIAAFQGKSEAQWGDIAAFWGDIAAFEGSANPSWGDIAAFAAKQYAYGALQAQFQGLVDQAAAVYGDRVSAETGSDFWNGFASNVFAKYGMDLNNPASLASLSELDRVRFMFDWQDGLRQFSGFDQMDYWMGATNWTPALSYLSGAGDNTVIGLVDFQLTDSAELGNRLISTGGYDLNIHGHGSAVASLLAAGHNGRGIAGIAPGASIAAYNPFDETATAGWHDIGLGVIDVLGQGASVVNMSLGVPDSTFHPEWAEVYGQQAVLEAGKNAVFVHAAGNEGFAQTQNIDWDFGADLNIVVVGSVGPNGQISSFSNTPGSACFLANGSCLNENLLMNRFLVAPGEWLLVSDGEGGVTRRSGTSFATPMVTGAVALLQNRWGWLKEHPSETVDILFRTATDLGAPGVDDVYGHGLLNIAASQSPLSMSGLYQLASARDGSSYKVPLAFAYSTEDLMWNTNSARMSVYEDIGSTFRDFAAPVDAMLTGTRTMTGDPTESLQLFMQDSFSNWFDGAAQTYSLADQFSTGSADIRNPFGWDMRMSISRLPYGTMARREGLPFATEVSITSPDDVTLKFGRGHGANAIAGFSPSGSGAFDPRTGGLNPVLGLASGGGFAKAEIPVGDGARLDIGVTERQFEALLFQPFSGEEQFLYQGVDPYRAMAANITLTQPVRDNLSVSAGYTYLSERDGLLGVQSLNPAGFAAGAETDAMTMGVAWSPTSRLEFGGSATLARTRGTGAGDQLFAVNREGIVNTAFEASMSLNGVFSKIDRARFAIVQPLHIEQGGLDLNSLEVVDRSLGVIGQVATYTPLNTRARELAFEAYYSTPVMNGQALLAGFVRAELESSNTFGRDAEQLVGAQFKIGF